VVDSPIDRLSRVDARLVREVDFGWGLLGRLYRVGGSPLEQRYTGTGRWAITKLELHFTGRIFLFEKLKIDFVTQTSDFRQMPDNLTLKERLQLLLAGGQMTAQPWPPEIREILTPATLHLLTSNILVVSSGHKSATPPNSTIRRACLVLVTLRRDARHGTHAMRGQ
jgi:hypothetical protein